MYTYIYVCMCVIGGRWGKGKELGGGGTFVSLYVLMYSVQASQLHMVVTHAQSEAE